MSTASWGAAGTLQNPTSIQEATQILSKAPMRSPPSLPTLVATKHKPFILLEISCFLAVPAAPLDYRETATSHKKCPNAPQAPPKKIVPRAGGALGHFL